MGFLSDLAEDGLDYLGGWLDALARWRRRITAAGVAIETARILHETAEETLPLVWTYDTARKHVAVIVHLRDFEHVLQAIQSEVVLIDHDEGAMDQYQLVHAAYLDEREQPMAPRDTHIKGMKWFRVYLRSRFNPRYKAYTMDLEDRRTWGETWASARWHGQVPELLWEATAFPPLTDL
jgi:hypothetical protein